MIRKIPSPLANCVRVIFELPACLWADRIFLVGDFNNWDMAITPFAQGRDGIWQAVMDLPVGRDYEFRYLVDGMWQTDLHADGWTANAFGSQNSIVSAILPPDVFPALSDSSLVSEKLPKLGHINRHLPPIHSTPQVVRGTPSRYFAHPAKTVN